MAALSRLAVCSSCRDVRALAHLGKSEVVAPVCSFPARAWSSTVRLRAAAVAAARLVAARATADPAPASAGNDADGDALTAEFIRYVESTQQAWPLEGRRPTHLMPPSTVVKAMMDALMRNDWPEDDSGIRTAFSFAMPPAANEIMVGEIGHAGRSARAWYATEKYLSFSEFAEVIREYTYAPLLNFSRWEMGSPLTFHGPGDKRAVQAVKTFSEAEGVSEIANTFTFCLEKVLQGAYKDCWMVVGVRVGDYANV